MLNNSPYDTMYGRLLNINPIVKELFKFIASTKNINLNYDIKNENGVNLVFITGCSVDERELPSWDHPVVFKDHRDRLTVAVDIRKYVKVLDEQPISIFEVARDKNVMSFIALRAIGTVDFASGNYGCFRNQYKNIITAFSMVMTNVINNVVMLNPIERVNVEIAMAVYYSHIMIATEDIKGNASNIIARIVNSRFSIPVNAKSVETVIAMLDPEITSFQVLIENIKRVVAPEKANLITKDIFVNGITTFWYGQGGSETMLISLEHVPTWVAMMQSATTDNSLKRSKLAMMLDKYNKNIKTPEFNKGIEQYLKDRMF